MVVVEASSTVVMISPIPSAPMVQVMDPTVKTWPAMREIDEDTILLR